jgi:hypothetical protein
MHSTKVKPMKLNNCRFAVVCKGIIVLLTVDGNGFLSEGSSGIRFQIEGI